MKFQKIALLGVGLIGASLGKALRVRGLAECVTGVGRSLKNLEEALERGCVTEIVTSGELEKAVSGAQLVVVCTPVGTVVPSIRECAKFSTSDTIFTDAGSTKLQIVRDLQTLPGNCIFVGGHPIAGKETSGAAAADENLYVEKLTVLTPSANTPAAAVERVRELWESVGSRVVCMSAEEHDAALAAVSHLPHIVSCVLSESTDPALLPYSGTGYQSVSRLSAGNVEVWRDILLANRAPILEAMERYQTHLERFRTLLAAGDAAGLEAFLTQARQSSAALHED